MLKGERGSEEQRDGIFKRWIDFYFRGVFEGYVGFLMLTFH